MANIPAEALRAAKGPDNVGQSTAVEQSRAVAEVQASVLIADSRPRDIDDCRTRLRVTCEMPTTAEEAFYSFQRANKTINGPTVVLAREIAACWTNISHGTRELARHHGYSEMNSWAWDLETNTRASFDFHVMHVRDTQEHGPKPLTTQRDIRESNQADAGRSLREAIFNVVPRWFTEEAVSICHATLEKDAGELPARVDAAVKMFEELGIPLERLAARLGKAKSQWTVFDLAQLKSTYRLVSRGEQTPDQAFPQASKPITAAELSTGKSGSK